MPPYNPSDPHGPPLTDLWCRKVWEVPPKWCKEHTHWPNVHLLHLQGGEHSWQALTHPNDPHDPQWEREGSTHDKHSHIPVIHMIPKRERVIKKYKPEGILREHAINVPTLCRREGAQTAWALNERQGGWWWFEIKSKHSFRTTFESQLFVHVCQFPHTCQHSHLMLYRSFKADIRDCMPWYHLKCHVIAYFNMVMEFHSPKWKNKGSITLFSRKKRERVLPMA